MCNSGGTHKAPWLQAYVGMGPRPHRAEVSPITGPHVSLRLSTLTLRKRTKVPRGPSPPLGTLITGTAGPQPLSLGCGQRTERCPGPSCSPAPEFALQGACLAEAGGQACGPSLSEPIHRSEASPHPGPSQRSKPVRPPTWLAPWRHKPKSFLRGAQGQLAARGAGMGLQWL